MDQHYYKYTKKPTSLYISFQSSIQLLLALNIELDGVGPVDNRPSTN